MGGGTGDSKTIDDSVEITFPRRYTHDECENALLNVAQTLQVGIDYHFIEDSHNAARTTPRGSEKRHLGSVLSAKGEITRQYPWSRVYFTSETDINLPQDDTKVGGVKLSIQQQNETNHDFMMDVKNTLERYIPPSTEQVEKAQHTR